MARIRYTHPDNPEPIICLGYQVETDKEEICGSCGGIIPKREDVIYLHDLQYHICHDCGKKMVYIVSGGDCKWDF